jgi:type IX secretion system PorP/SprF family membrane protein
MKKFFRLIFLLAALVFQGAGFAWAQDIHYSQFYASPLNISPSNTGNMEGDFRICANYRSQWKEISKPYSTPDISYDQNFYIRNERISGGAILIDDQSGGNLSVMKFLLSAAYHKTISGNCFHVGIQYGFVEESYNPNLETYPDQFSWASGQFDSNLPNGETQLNNSMHYFDLNAGLGWNKKITKKLEPFVSIAFYHLNFPKESFFQNGTNVLGSREVIHAGINIQLNNEVCLIPAVFFMGTDKASELIGGSNIEYLLSSTTALTNLKAVYAGLYFREDVSLQTDAGFVVVGMKYNRYNVGFSYDMNVSSLHTATDYRGAFEISLIYTGLNTRITKMQVPCDRY